ncbi:MAG: TetR/AcrR family transcriptional regulator [Acidimicrobiia bacterium]
MLKRRTRAQIVQDNRDALLVAARRMFERLGYHGATIDAIAEEAGFTKGAVYSQFGSKDDLFLAVIERNIEHRYDAFAHFIELADASSDPAELVELAYDQTVASIAWQAALIEFRVHAWRNDDVNRRYGELHQQTIDGLARLIGALHARLGIETPGDLADLAVGFLGGGSGLVLELLTNPDTDPRTFVASMTAFGGRSSTGAMTE